MNKRYSIKKSNKVTLTDCTTNDCILGGLAKTEKIPTDFVYTGKMVFGVQALLANNYFPAGSRILLIHSGGLQGNRSIAQGILPF